MDPELSMRSPGVPGCPRVPRPGEVRLHRVFFEEARSAQRGLGRPRVG